MPEEITPDTPSSDYAAMVPYWIKAQTMLDGTEAMRKIKAFLPRFPRESRANYEHRRANAKFTNVFRDIVENLASKPFAKKTSVKDGTVSGSIAALIDDIDGAGNHLHVFAGTTFFNGIAKALDYIFVDYTKVPVGASLAVEKAMGARPYWVRLPAERVVAAYTAMIGGTEEFVHVRVLEPTTIRRGFRESVMERVRVYDRQEIEHRDEASGIVTTKYGPATWTLLEKRKKANTSEFEWVAIDSGVLRIGRIPLVPFVTGRRKEGSWQFNAPMEDAADLQIEMYQQETNLKAAKEMSCFPMIKALGVQPPTDAKGNPADFPTGPGVVVYSPPGKDGSHGDYGFLEPSATSLSFLASEIDKTEKQLRELGRQPLTAQSGNLTTVTTAVAAAKGNSAVQAWALNLKDALERALQFTMLWMDDTTSDPVVNVYTDFGIELGDGTSMGRLIDMRRNGDLDRDTLWAEAVRRGELSADFDASAAKQRLADEAPQDPSEDDLIAAFPPRHGPPEKIAA